VSLTNKHRMTAFWLVLLVMTLCSGVICPASATAQTESNTDELNRKPKTKVSPAYPDIARRMSITGTVKLAVVVSPNGVVKSTRAVGGHPLLVDAAMNAMKRWKFESAPTESSGIVEFKFQPQN
jgi:TonB family protein